MERDPHAITDALPNLIACLRGAVELRGHGALAPEGGVGFNRRESIDGLEGEAATRRREARVAVASFAPVFAKMIAAYYAKKAHHPPGEVPKERRRAKEQVERETAQAAIAEMCADGLAIIQQLTSPENDASSEEDAAAAAMVTDDTTRILAPPCPSLRAHRTPSRCSSYTSGFTRRWPTAGAAAAPTGRGLFCGARCPV